MLKEFTVECYRSFYKPATLRLVSDKDGSTARFTAIYGGNAAGKSNLIKAMRDAKRIITNPDYKLKAPVFSKTDSIDPSRISRFEFVFSMMERNPGSDEAAEPRTYRYTIRISSKMTYDPLHYVIVSEELYDEDAGEIIFDEPKDDRRSIFGGKTESNKDDVSASDNEEKRNAINKEYESAIEDKRILERSENELTKKLNDCMDDFNLLSDPVKKTIEDYYKAIDDDSGDDE